MLTRGCECLLRCGPEDMSRPDLCVVHRLEARLENTPVGGRLFTKEATQALKEIRRYAKLLKYPHADLLTWKAVRAGKTTSLAAHGVTLPQLMEQGEWAGANSHRSYVDEDTADAVARLRMQQIEPMEPGQARSDSESAESD